MELDTERDIKETLKNIIYSNDKRYQGQFNTVEDIYNNVYKICKHSIYEKDYEYFVDNTLLPLLDGFTLDTSFLSNGKTCSFNMKITNPFICENRNPDICAMNVSCSLVFTLNDSRSVVNSVCLFVFPILNNTKYATMYCSNNDRANIDGVMDINNLYIKTSMFTNLSTQDTFITRRGKNKKNTSVMCGITQFHNNNYIPMLFEIRYTLHNKRQLNDKILKTLWDVRMPDKIQDKIIPLSHFIYLFTGGDVYRFTSMMSCKREFVVWLESVTSSITMEIVITELEECLRHPPSSRNTTHSLDEKITDLKDYIKRRIYSSRLDDITDESVIYMLFNMCMRVIYATEKRCMQYNNGVDVYRLSVFNENFAAIVMSYLSNLEKVVFSSITPNIDINAVQCSVLQALQSPNITQYVIKYIESHKPPSLTKYKPPDHTQLVNSNIPRYAYIGEQIRSGYIDPVVVEMYSNTFNLNTIAAKKYITAGIMNNIVVTEYIDSDTIRRRISKYITNSGDTPVFIDHVYVGCTNDMKGLYGFVWKMKKESYLLAQLDVYIYDKRFITISCLPRRLLRPVFIKSALLMPNVFKIMRKCYDSDERVYMTNIIRAGLMTLITNRDMVNDGYCLITEMNDPLYIDAKYILIGDRFNDNAHCDLYPSQSEVPINRQAPAIKKLHTQVLTGNEYKCAIPPINNTFTLANMALKDDMTPLDSIAFSPVARGAHSLCYVTNIRHEIAEFIPLDEKTLNRKYSTSPRLKGIYDKNGIIRLYKYVTANDDLVLGMGINKKCPCKEGYVMKIKWVGKRVFIVIRLLYVPSHAAKMVVNGYKGVLAESFTVSRNQYGNYNLYYIGHYGMHKRSLSSDAFLQNKHVSRIPSTNITLGVPVIYNNCDAHVCFLQFYPGRHGNGFSLIGFNGKINRDFTPKNGPAVQGGTGLDWMSRPSAALKQFEQFFVEFGNMQDTCHCMDCNDIPHVTVVNKNKITYRCRNNPNHTVVVAAGVNLLKFNSYLRLHGFQLNYRMVCVRDEHTSGARKLFEMFPEEAEHTNIDIQ